MGNTVPLDGGYYSFPMEIEDHPVAPGQPAYLLGTHERWETAILLIVVTTVDLFGGYAFNIALSRRMVDVTPPLSP